MNYDASIKEANPYYGKTVLEAAWTAGFEGGKMRGCDEGSPYWKAFKEGEAARFANTSFEGTAA